MIKMSRYHNEAIAGGIASLYGGATGLSTERTTIWAAPVLPKRESAAAQLRPSGRCIHSEPVRKENGMMVWCHRTKIDMICSRADCKKCKFYNKIRTKKKTWVQIENANNLNY